MFTLFIYLFTLIIKMQKKSNQFFLLLEHYDIAVSLQVNLYIMVHIVYSTNALENRDIFLP